METFQFILKFFVLFLFLALCVCTAIKIENLENKIAQYEKQGIILETIQPEKPKDHIYKLKYKIDWNSMNGTGSIWEPIEETTKTMPNNF